MSYIPEHVNSAKFVEKDLYLFFKAATEEIVIAYERIEKEADAVRARPQVLPFEESEPQTVWLVLFIGLGVVAFLGAIIGACVYCCLRQRAADLERDYENDHQVPHDERNPEVMPSPLSPSPVPPAMSPGPRTPTRTPTPRTPTPRTPKRALTPSRSGKPPPLGLSPIGRSPGRHNDSY